MKSTRPIVPTGKDHGKSLDSLGGLSSRIEEVEAKMAALRAQRGKLLETHAAKAADAIVAGGMPPAAPDTKKLDSELEVLESVKRELARRRHVQANDELAARLRGLDGCLKVEQKRHATLLRTISDCEQQILQCRGDAEACVARQVDLQEQVAEAEHLAGGARVCSIVGTPDELDAAIACPAVLINQLEARKQLDKWRAGDPQMEVQVIDPATTLYHERKIDVKRACLIYDRETGRILEALVIDFADTNGNLQHNHRSDPPTYVRAWETQLRVDAYQEGAQQNVQ
jgi:hypothetical protein